MRKPPSHRTIQWVGGLDGWVELIDQTLLPGEPKLITCHDVETLWEAIRNLRVRGAPAIGVATAAHRIPGRPHGLPAAFALSIYPRPARRVPCRQSTRSHPPSRRSRS